MVKDQVKAIQIKDLMETLLEAIPDMMRMLSERSLDEFFELSSDLCQALYQIKKVAEIEKDDLVYDELAKTAYNCIVSLKRLLLYAKYNREKTMQKIEFELWPLLRIMHVRFYFMSLIYPDKEKMDEWYRTEGKELCKNYYWDEAEKTGKYKYDVSIVVTGYNKLDYTKMCVEKILNNLPRNIKCELILFNHGSSDGTKEFFERICPTKQFDIEINGAGTGALMFAYEGKYIFSISNDVLITPNMIEILYDAFEENEDYGFAVPMTSNICNIQTPVKLNNGTKRDLPQKYNNIDELEKFAKEINIRDKRLEEVRFRLCDPLAFIRSKCYDLGKEISLLSLTLTCEYTLMFPDDYRSMHIRRSGYKNIHMKDLYAHHFGGVTIKDEKLVSKDYKEGRRAFLEKNGIDPWGKAFCWSYELFDKLPCDKGDSKQILGINCGLGSNILKIQQEIRENTGNADVKIVTITERERYVPDLLTISDEVMLHRGWSDIRENIKDDYDYILVDSMLEDDEYQINIKKLYEHIVSGGTMIVLVPETRNDMKEWIKTHYDDVQETAKSKMIYEIDEEYESNLLQYGNYLFWKKS